ncbi:MAG: CoA transferase, partial [Pseudomonadota bacterium]
EAVPWSVMERPWAVYDLFETADGTQLFVGVVGDGQWRDFCVAFERDDLLADMRLQTNSARSAARPWLIPIIADMMRKKSVADLSEIFERLGLPFAPVQKPGDLFDDPHLNASGGLVDVALPAGGRAKAPTLPVTLGGRRLAMRADPPAVGGDTIEILRRVNVTDADIQRLMQQGVIVADQPAASGNPMPPQTMPH